MPELESPITPPNNHEGSPLLVASSFFQPYHLRYNHDEMGIMICNPKGRVLLGAESEERPRADGGNSVSSGEVAIVEQMRDISLGT